MLTILLGPDDYSKRQYIVSMELKFGEKAGFFIDTENLPILEELVGADLFSKAKIYVLKNSVAFFNAESSISQLIASKNQILLLEDKLDKRNTDNKKLLANKNIAIKEFNLPHGKELDNWLVMRAQESGVKLSTNAANILAKVLGRDNAKETKVAGKTVAVQEVYNLWQANNELQKLISYTKNGEITEADILSLVPLNEEMDVFDLTNAIGDGDKQKTLSLMDRFLGQQTVGEEKGSAIQLNALLAEQFRNVATIQDFLFQKKSEAEILDILGWKPGRLFIMKKVASKFSQASVLSLLAKLKALDEELKTGSVPPRVLLDLITVQLWKE